MSPQCLGANRSGPDDDKRQTHRPFGLQPPQPDGHTPVLGTHPDTSGMDGAEIRPQDALLGELFTTTSRILMAADTGAGKTMFGFAVAFAMHLGRDFLHWKAHRPANVVYIDGEMPSDLIQDRIAEACRWFDISPPDNGPYFLSREDYEDMEPLDTVEGKQWLEDKLHMFAGAGDKPDFVVFDNIKSLCSGVMKDEESWHAMEEVVFGLSKNRIGQMWLHHTGIDTSRAYGTKTREWAMDTVIIGDSKSKDHVHVDLRFTKRDARSRATVRISKRSRLSCSMAPGAAMRMFRLQKVAPIRARTLP